jgi:hypothetical protein
VDAFEEIVLDVAHLVLDSFGQVAVVDEHAKFQVDVLRTPGEVRAGDNEESVIDGDELRVVPDRAPVERDRAQDYTGPSTSRSAICFASMPVRNSPSEASGEEAK